MPRLPKGQRPFRAKLFLSTGLKNMISNVFCRKHKCFTEDTVVLHLKNGIIIRDKLTAEAIWNAIS